MHHPTPQAAPSLQGLNPEKPAPQWEGLPYFPISQFYRQRFGERVRKISISFAQTCPNREGLNGMKVCNFCDVWGSAAYPDKRELTVPEQIEQIRSLQMRQFKARKFLVYFQAYTTTFSKVRHLREQLTLALEQEGVVGAVIGTRPDCLSDAVLDLWHEFSQTKFIAVEMGVQSFVDEHLKWMSRGHTAARSLWGLNRIHERCPKVDLGIHLIFGLPGETDAQIIAAATQCNQLPITNVKLHNLHVLKNTTLAEDYLAGKFQPISRDEYFRRCEVFLRHLSPKIAVHRLAALSNKPGELLAPEWTAFKMKTYQDFISYMLARGSYQGQDCSNCDSIN